MRGDWWLAMCWAVSRAPLNHAVGVLLPQGIGGELAGAAGGRPEKRPVEVLGDASCGEVGVEVQLQVVMTGDCMLLASLLVQPDPAAASLQEVVPDPSFAKRRRRGRRCRPWRR